jgi:hypothetical protein
VLRDIHGELELLDFVLLFSECHFFQFVFWEQVIRVVLFSVGFVVTLFFLDVKEGFSPGNVDERFAIYLAAFLFCKLDLDITFFESSV